MEKTDYTTEPSVRVTLFQGLPKSDKFEMIVQKCTELGVSEIVPVIMDRVIVKIDDKNIDKPNARITRIFISGIK